MDKNEIRHIAENARISFTDEALDNFSNDFLQTMELIDSIKDVDTEGVQETYIVNNIENKCREDEVKESLTQEKALENTATKKYGYFEIIRFVE